MQSILGTLEPAWILAGVWGPMLRGWFEQLGRAGRSGVEMEGEQFRSEQSGREARREEKAGTFLERQGCGGVCVSMWRGWHAMTGKAGREQGWENPRSGLGNS